MHSVKSASGAGGEEGSVGRVSGRAREGKTARWREKSEPFGTTGRRAEGRDEGGARTSNLAVRHVYLLTTRSPRGSRYVVEEDRPQGSVSVGRAGSVGKFDPPDQMPKSAKQDVPNASLCSHSASATKLMGASTGSNLGIFPPSSSSAYVPSPRSEILHPRPTLTPKSASRAKLPSPSGDMKISTSVDCANPVGPFPLTTPSGGTHSNACAPGPTNVAVHSASVGVSFVSVTRRALSSFAARGCTRPKSSSAFEALSSGWMYLAVTGKFCTSPLSYRTTSAASFS